MTEVGAASTYTDNLLTNKLEEHNDTSPINYSSKEESKVCGEYSGSTSPGLPIDLSIETKLENCNGLVGGEHCKTDTFSPHDTLENIVESQVPRDCGSTVNDTTTVESMRQMVDHDTTSNEESHPGGTINTEAVSIASNSLLLDQLAQRDQTSLETQNHIEDGNLTFQSKMQESSTSQEMSKAGKSDMVPESKIKMEQTHIETDSPNHSGAPKDCLSRTMNPSAPEEVTPLGVPESNSLTSPSLKKKKSFWSRVANIFKPWKWRRKKRSKKMENHVVELERRLSLRKPREELIKRGLIKEADDAQNTTQPEPMHVSTDLNSTAANPPGAESSQVELDSTQAERIPSPDITDSIEERSETSRSFEQPLVDILPSLSVNGDTMEEEGFTMPPPPTYNEPPPYAPPPPPLEYDDSSSEDGDQTSIPLVKEVPIREPDLNAVPKKSALKKPIITRPVVVIRNPKSKKEYFDRGSYHSSEDSSDEEIRYNDAEEGEGLAAKVWRNDSLARFLERRPNQKQLEERNILHSGDNKSISNEREETVVKLGRRLSMRPTHEELEQRNILHESNQTDRKAEIAEIRVNLNRKLSFRPTIEELKQRNILQFSEYVEVTEAEEYDRRADKPWTRLTPRDKAAIRKELNEFKEKEMSVHEDSIHNTRYHRP